MDTCVLYDMYLEQKAKRSRMRKLEEEDTSRTSNGLNYNEMDRTPTGFGNPYLESDQYKSQQFMNDFRSSIENNGYFNPYEQQGQMMYQQQYQYVDPMYYNQQYMYDPNMCYQQPQQQMYYDPNMYYQQQVYVDPNMMYQQQMMYYNQNMYCQQQPYYDQYVYYQPQQQVQVQQPEPQPVQVDPEEEMDRYIESEQQKIKQMFDKEAIHGITNMTLDEKYVIYSNAKALKDNYCNQQLRYLESQGINDYNRRLYEFYQIELFGRDKYEMLNDGNEHIILTDNGFEQYPNKKPLEEEKYITDEGEIISVPIVPKSDFKPSNQKLRIKSLSPRSVSRYRSRYQEYMENEVAKLQKMNHEYISRLARLDMGISDEQYLQMQRQQEEQIKQQQAIRQEMAYLNAMDKCTTEYFPHSECTKYNNYVYELQKKAREECPMDSSSYDFIKYLTKQRVKMRNIDLNKIECGASYNSYSYGKRLDQDTKKNDDDHSFGRTNIVPPQFAKNIVFEEEDDSMDVDVLKLIHELNQKRPPYKAEVADNVFLVETAPRTLEIKGNEKINENYMRRKKLFMEEAKNKN